MRPPKPPAEPAPGSDERDLAEASTQLLPAHPRMKQLNANVADIRRQVQREAATVVDGLEREAKVLLALHGVPVVGPPETIVSVASSV